MEDPLRGTLDTDRDFDAAIAARPKKIKTFRLGGQVFTANASLRVAMMREMRRAEGAESNEIFIQRMLVTDDDRDRFAALLDDPDVEVESSDIGDVANWLFEVAAGRPTVPLTDSSDGRMNGGRGSTARKRNAAPIRENSRSIGS